MADNGRGIPPDDYATLALKYHTSKLHTFEDLQARCASCLHRLHLPRTTWPCLGAANDVDLCTGVFAAVERAWSTGTAGSLCVRRCGVLPRPRRAGVRRALPRAAQELSTFGFRGEALSSLCALAEVAVVTRTAEQQVRGQRRPDAGRGPCRLRSAGRRSALLGAGLQRRRLLARCPKRVVAISASAATGAPPVRLRFRVGRAGLRWALELAGELWPRRRTRGCWQPHAQPCAQVGSSLEYDREGRLAKQSLAARAPGTTVALRNLFAPLPVRHKVRRLQLGQVCSGSEQDPELTGLLCVGFAAASRAPPS